jgi:MFS family permease
VTVSRFEQQQRTHEAQVEQAAMKSPIPLPRFSLKTLFIAVLVLAIALAALKFANPIWASSLFTLLLVVLFAGFLGAVFGRGERRVFCAGLVLSGLGYLLAVYGPWFESHVSGHLATTRLLNHVHSGSKKSTFVPVSASTSYSELARMLRNPGDDTAARDRQVVMTTQPAMGVRVTIGPSRNDIMRVGHSLFAFLMAVAGGATARWIWLRGQQLSAVNAPAAGCRVERHG